MNINEASQFFKSLRAQAHKKSEIKLYTSFIVLLTDLESKNLTTAQFQAIEVAIDGLKLKASTGNRKKYYKQKFTEFTTFLKEEFSFITEGHYSGLGMVFGMMFGTALGLTFGSGFMDGAGIGIGMSIGTGSGMVIGMMIGASKDAEAKLQGRVLKTQSK